MGEDEYDPPIIRERPFLETIKAIIYIRTGEVHMDFPSEKATQPKPEEANHQGRMGRLQRRCNKVQRYIQLEQNCPEETVAPSQVWSEKIVIHEEEALPEPLTTPSSESQDD